MWYRGRAGYNGGHGKREILHDLADLMEDILKKTGNYQLGKLFLSVFTAIGDRIQGFLTVDANLDINENILVSDKTILSKTAQSKPSVVPPTANSSFLEVMSRETV
ncbi:hypothetical protein J6590_000552 [Homalodisca vitripennis]|nr:hypothetical protein J6590_000552 [Homalodisca vitripennis]